MKIEVNKAEWLQDYGYEVIKIEVESYIVKDGKKRGVKQRVLPNVEYDDGQFKVDHYVIIFNDLDMRNGDTLVVKTTIGEQ